MAKQITIKNATIITTKDKKIQIKNGIKKIRQ